MPALLRALDAMRLAPVTDNARGVPWSEWLRTLLIDHPGARVSGWRDKIATSPELDALFVAGQNGKPQFDLEAYVVHRLIAAGIDEIEAVNLDTYADDTRFFSFRRASHRSEADYGRQLSAIAIPG